MRQILNELIAQKDRLERIRSFYDEGITSIDVQRRIMTMNELKAFRLLLSQLLQTQSGLGQLYSLEKKRKECLLEIQVFNSEYSQLNIRERLEQRNRLYALLSTLCENLQKVITDVDNDLPIEQNTGNRALREPEI